MLFLIAIPLLSAISVISAKCLTGVNISTTMDQTSRMTLTNARFDFALDSLKRTASIESKGNVFFSPHIIYQAMSLAYIGARGTIEKSLKQALRIPRELSKVDVQRYYAIERSLNQMRSQKNNSADSNDYRVANRFWITNSKRLRECVPEFFGDQLQVTDFRKNPTEVRNHINNWVSNMTKGHICNLLPLNSITKDTDLVLVNAVYFKGLWASRFDLKNSRRDIFYASGTKNTTIFMRQKGNFNCVFSVKLGAYILELPYKGNEISMFVLLPSFSTARSVQDPSSEPQDDIRQLVESLLTKNGSRELRKLLDGGLLPREVEVSLPRFELERELPMDQLLFVLGAGELVNAADLRGFDAVHRARIEVTEEGTTAAAARSLIRYRPVVLNANHPFVYLIYNKADHTVLFIGIFRSSLGVSNSTPGAQKKN